MKLVEEGEMKRNKKLLIIILSLFEMVFFQPDSHLTQNRDLIWSFKTVA